MDSNIVIYEAEDGTSKIDVQIDGETVWLSQKQMADLFGKDRKTITEHIGNVFKEGELVESSVCRKFQHTAEDGKNYNTNFYNLDVIISVGYRVKSVRGTQFRKWATERLREYLVQGFSMNDEFLKNNGGGVYWKKLLARIRDIRSSEKMLYRQVLDLYATSIDYEPKSLQSIKFFKIVQNKLHFAVHKQTASEVIYSRADSDKEFMGLTTFAGDLPVLEEVRIAKNYLNLEELEKLNRLVSAYFELAELRAIKHEKMEMADHIKALDRLLSEYGDGVLIGSGQVSHKKAIEKAEREYRKYQAKTLSPGEVAYLESIKTIQNKVKNKFKSRK